MQDICTLISVEETIHPMGSVYIPVACCSMLESSPIPDHPYLNSLLTTNLSSSYYYNSEQGMGLKITNNSNLEIDVKIPAGSVFIPESKLDIPKSNLEEKCVNNTDSETISKSRIGQDLYIILKEYIPKFPRNFVEIEGDLLDMFSVCEKSIRKIGGNLEGYALSIANDLNFALDIAESGFILKDVYLDDIRSRLRSKDLNVREGAEKKVGELVGAGLCIAAGMSVAGLAGEVYLGLEVINKARHLYNRDDDWIKAHLYRDLLTQLKKRDVVPIPLLKRIFPGKKHERY